MTANPSVRKGAGWGVAGLLAGGAFLLALFLSGMVLLPRYRAAHPAGELQRSDAHQVAIDDVYLDVTLATPAFVESRRLERYLGERDPASVLPILVGLNTHTGTIEHMHHLHGELRLVGPDGARYPAISEPIVLSQHHNAYMLLFPARDHHGLRFLEMEEGALAVEARGVGRKELRRFEWDLPVDASLDGFGGERGLASTLMLSVALLSALLVVLSPCALELSLYYSAIISCTVAQGEREAASAGSPAAERAGRRRVLRNLSAFVAGFTLLYAVSGAGVGFIGESVRKPFGGTSEIVQVLGGLLILFFALRVLGATRVLARPGAWLRRRLRRRLPSPRALGGLATLPGRALAALRVRGMARSRNGEGMRAVDSFLVGVGLSSACLGCMGGAVLYPLLVYAGITSWSAGLLTLTLYSLGIALPMVFIALGFFRLRLSLVRRLGLNRVLRGASGLLLASIGLLVLTGYERILTDLAFSFFAEVSRWAG